MTNYGLIGLTFLMNAIIFLMGYMSGRMHYSRKMVDVNFELLLENLRLRAQWSIMEDRLNELHKRNTENKG